MATLEEIRQWVNGGVAEHGQRSNEAGAKETGSTGVAWSGVKGQGHLPVLGVAGCVTIKTHMQSEECILGGTKAVEPWTSTQMFR